MGQEIIYAEKRQEYLTAQGYYYKVVEQKIPSYEGVPNETWTELYQSVYRIERGMLFLQAFHTEEDSDEEMEPTARKVGNAVYSCVIVGIFRVNYQVETPLCIRQVIIIK